MAWFIVVLFIVIFSVAVSLSLSIHYGSSADSNDLDTVKEYALTDKVIRSYNHDFCQGLEAVSTDVPVGNLQSNATLYLLNSRPSLTDSEHFNLSERTNLDSTTTNYHSWNFYLNAGSKASFNVCYPLDMSGNYYVKFYLIKGTKNHNKWTGDPDSSYAVKYSRLVSKCQTISYQAHQDDLYFFVFYLDSIYISLTTILDIDFQFDRTVYHISPDDVVQSCSFPLNGYSSCSISVPMSSGYTALLSLNTSLPVDYNDGANVQINCQRRAWLYAVIVVCAMLPVIIIIALIVTYICIRVRRGKKKYSSLSANPQSGSVSTSASQYAGHATTTESAFEKSGGSSTNPPAYNPSYPAQAGGVYGATSHAPPPPYAN